LGDGPITRRILALSLSAFVLLTAAGLAAIYLADRAAEAERWIVHTLDVRRAARALLVELLNAETSARGYALTQDERFLEPYERATPQIRGLVDELQRLTADNQSQQARIRELRPKIDARMAELVRVAALVRQGRREEAVAVVRTAVGMGLMGEIRAGIESTFEEETSLLLVRQETARALRLWVLGSIVLCLLSAVGLAALAFRGTLHYVDRLEEESRRRRQAEETLRQSQRLEAVGQLTGGIAHDFNNLLTIIVGNLDTIKRRIAEDAGELATKLRGLVDNALEGARSSSRLTQQLLAFSRRQALDPKRLDLNRVVSGMSDLLRRTLGETVDVETVLAGGLWSTYADANQVENALINLATNARDAMPGGGKITIETANTFLDEAYAGRFGDVTAGQYVLLSVTDTGSGIAPETIGRVFEPFFTTKETGKGTGLGLAMVHGFVKQSGGHIRVYSEVGHGTTVKIYLPRLREAEEISAAPAPVQPAAAGEVRAREGQTVLLVEDNDGVRAYARSSLEELGFRVLEASNAKQALRLLDEAPRVDLLFTDVVLPGGMSGRQLADIVLRRRPSLPVLFTTGYTRNAIVHHGRLDPDVNLLNKPFTQQDLARKIAAILQAA
jgi:signal transduction histidine kinase/CheY-like chemotaxis protein